MCANVPVSTGVFCKGLECCTQRQLQSRLSFSCHFYWHEKTNEKEKEEGEECPDLIREVVRGSTDDLFKGSRAGDAAELRLSGS